MKFIVFCLSLLFVYSATIAQPNQPSPILTAVPFLSIESNPRVTGMGEIGVVASPIYFESGLRQNPALLARNKKVAGGRISRNAWLPQLNIQGLGIIDVGGYYSISKNHTIGYHARQFRLGQIQLANPNGPNVRTTDFAETSHSLRYAVSLTSEFSIGIGLTYFISQLNFPTNPPTPPARGMAGDIGIQYLKTFSIGENKDLLLNIGGSVTNIGSKVSYGVTTLNSDFIPTNLQLGALFGYHSNLSGNIRLGIEIAYQGSKLLVPTEGPRSSLSALEGMFSSFGDAPGGFSEEIQEIIHQVGLEGRIQYKNQFMSAIRMGTFLEHDLKGARKYLTLGTGIGVYGFRLDAAYILPYNPDLIPLKGFRFGLACNFDLDQEGLRLMEW